MLVPELRFLARCHKSDETVLSYLLAYVLFSVLLFIGAPFCVWLFYIRLCSVFWLFWSSCQYLPSDCLEKLKTNDGEGIVSTKPRLKNVYGFCDLVHCFVGVLASEG